MFRTRPLFLLLFFLVPALTAPARGWTEECSKCHEALLKHKKVHAAVRMGCASCHTGIDSSTVPHKNTGTRGLSSETPELCYGCHDKGAFTKKTAHAALQTGCTGCHDPHSSDNDKLLSSPVPDVCFNCHDKNSFSGKKDVHSPVAGGSCTSCHNPHSSDFSKLLLSDPPELCFNCHKRESFKGEVVHSPVGIGLCTGCHSPHQSDNGKLLISGIPDLCFNCHNKAGFGRKNVHVPVAGGMCMSCHKPHASESFALLAKKGNGVCIDCHATVRKEPHAIVGFSTVGHPLGGVGKPRGKEKKPFTIKDPIRQGKIFYCGSCHDPHSSDWKRLFRYKSDTAFELCRNCHNM